MSVSDGLEAANDYTIKITTKVHPLKTIILILSMDITYSRLVIQIWNDEANLV